MIKKSLRAYITSRQLVFFILADGKMMGLFRFQCVKHQVHRVLELLVVLPDLHRVDELDESGKVLFFHRGFIVDISDEGAIQKRFCL